MGFNRKPIIDSTNPEWTETDFARSGRPEDVLPAEVLAAFPMTHRQEPGQPTPSAEQAPHGRLRIRPLDEPRNEKIRSVRSPFKRVKVSRAKGHTAAK